MSPTHVSPAPRGRTPRPALLPALAMVVAGSVTMGWQLADFIGDSSLATTLISPMLRENWLGRQSETTQSTALLGPWIVATVGVGLGLWLVVGALVARTGGLSTRAVWARWGTAGWAWWLVSLLFPLGDLATAALDVGSPDSHWQAWWRSLVPFFSAHLVAGWLATLVAVRWECGVTGSARDPSAALPPTGGQEDGATSAPGGPGAIPHGVWLAVAGYSLLFGWLNWRLYDSLMLPHGDSAMYEEHLWNLIHGKGFRSWLDDGRLFLGEHIQVVHLAAIPLYLVWPSHMLLEWLQSLALALGAVPLYRLSARASGSRVAGTLMATAYLLAFPLQFLDIAIDFKTFRPNSFEIPFLLAALDALERRRWRACGLWALATLVCQEDAATVLGPLGLWVACCWPDGVEETPPAGSPSARTVRWTGLAVALLSVLYVGIVIRVVLPWFRGGADVHFAQYFTELGDSSGGIVSALVRHPELIWRRLGRAESGLFAIGLLAPWGWLPCLSPSRCLVAAPLFVVLCLSDITDSPQHHFHAPLVPILAWAAAHGLGRGRELSARIGIRRGGAANVSLRLATSGENGGPQPRPGVVSETRCGVVAGATWAMVSALVTGFWIGLSPLSIAFWDPGSPGYWRNRYLETERSRQIAKVVDAIPRSARVASTDYVHPRFTHHERSYDYSDYRPMVPPDCDYIVIDLRGPGSRISHPSQIRELREQPLRWRLLPDETRGQFAILQRLEPSVRPGE